MIALLAAYAIVLSGLIANFGSAYATASATGSAASAICHHAPAGEPSPFGDQDNNNACLDCCIGCLMPMAALPPPPAKATPASAIVSRHVAPVMRTALAGMRAVDIYRSRAPPA